MSGHITRHGLPLDLDVNDGPITSQVEPVDPPIARGDVARVRDRLADLRDAYYDNANLVAGRPAEEQLRGAAYAYGRSVLALDELLGQDTRPDVERQEATS